MGMVGVLGRGQYLEKSDKIVELSSKLLILWGGSGCAAGGELALSVSGPHPVVLRTCTQGTRGRGTLGCHWRA